MKGFLRRDFALVSGNLRFYLFFIAIFGALALFTDMNSGFVMFYAVIFAMSSIIGLFSYDEFNHWTAYAAAVPGGRKNMVKARYTLLLLVTVGVAAVQMLVGALAKEMGNFQAAALYSGMLLIYAALSMPLSYYFGGTKARVVTVVLVAFIAGAAAIMGTILNISTGFGDYSLPSGFLLLPAVGAGALLISYRVSLHIMAKKEL